MRWKRKYISTFQRKLSNKVELIVMELPRSQENRAGGTGSRRGRQRTLSHIDMRYMKSKQGNNNQTVCVPFTTSLFSFQSRVQNTYAFLFFFFLYLSLIDFYFLRLFKPSFDCSISSCYDFYFFKHRMLLQHLVSQAWGCKMIIKSYFCSQKLNNKKGRV